MLDWDDDPMAMALRSIDTSLRPSPARSELARRSYEHSNGFVKIFVHPVVEAEDWSVHVWRSADPDIHDHRWDFTSGVLVGSLAVDRFRARAEAAASAVLFHEFEHVPLGQAEGFTLDYQGETLLECIDTSVLQAGDHYHGDAEEPHRVTSSNAVTLFRRAPSRRWCTRVFKGVGVVSEQRTVVTHFDEHAYVARLEAIQTRLRDRG